VTAYALHMHVTGRIADLVAVAREAEAAGVDGIYGIEAFQDPFVPLAAIAAATTHIRIGTYVANAYAREPQSAASAAAKLDELSDGRFTFGIGAGNRHINEWLYGVDVWRPMQKMREYLEILDVLLRGGTTDATEVGGPTHRMQTRLARSAERRVPVVLAAAGPRMIELAGSMTDGVGVGILVSADHLASEIRPRARAAAEAVGADPDALRFPMAAMTNVDDDVDRARQRTRRSIAGLFHPVPHPYYDFLLREQGYAAVADACSELAPQQRWDEAMATIDDELIDRLTITGTARQCAARLLEYDGVADEIICLDRSGSQGSCSPVVLEMLSLARSGRLDVTG